MFTSLIFSFIFALHADGPGQPPHHDLKLTKVAGQPVVAVFSSGNVAEMKLNHNATVTLPTIYQVSENSCAAKVGQFFTIHFPVRADRLVFVWTKHSDAAKVGQAVTFGGNSKIPVAFQNIVSNGSQFEFPDLAMGLPKDVMEFNDVTWISGMEDGVLKPFSIETWFEEKMTRNSQTGANENRIVGSVSGIEIGVTDATHATIESMQSGQTVGTGEGLFLLVGDVASWIMKTPMTVCQVSSKPDLGKAQEILIKYLDSLSNEHARYNWQQDALSRLAEAQNSLFLNLEYADE